MILGEDLVTREQLNEELQAISDVIRVLRDQPKGGYGAEQLARQLEAGGVRRIMQYRSRPASDSGDLQWEP